MSNSTSNPSPINLISSDEIGRIRSRINKRLVIHSIIILFTFIGIAYVAYAYTFIQKQKDFNSVAASQLNTVDTLISNNLDFLENQVYQLAANPELHRYLLTRNDISKEFVLNNWLTISERLKWYSGIYFYSTFRLIDLGIDYDTEYELATITEISQDNKPDLDILHAHLRETSDIHISAIDLKKQFNEPVYPLTPILKIYTPVSITSDKIEGFIELDVLAEKLLAPVKHVERTQTGQLLLVDQNGFFLVGHSQEEEWGKYLQVRQEFNLSTQFPSAWKQIQAMEEGIVTDEANSFVFKKIQLHDVDSQYILVNHIPDEYIENVIETQTTRLNITLFFLYIMTSVALWGRSVRRYERYTRHQSLELISALFNSNDALIITDSKGVVISYNDSFQELIKLNNEFIIGTSINSILHKKKIKKLISKITKTIVKKGFWRGELSLKGGQGSIIPCLVSVVPVVTTDGNYSQYVIHAIDISKQKEIERELKLAAVALETRAGVVITDSHGLIQRVNASFTNITGYTAEEVIGKNPNILASGKHDKNFYETMWKDIVEKGYWKGELWNKRKFGDIYPELMTITSIKNSEGKVQNYVATFHDITTIKKLEQELESLASTDPLTGTLNRRAFEQKFNEQLNSTRRYKQLFGLILFDIDHFKQVNDTYGHDVGDEILKITVQKVNESLRETDVIARWGGEEFIILLPMNNENETSMTAERLRETIMAMNSIPTKITCSFGVTSYQSGDDFDIMLKRADMALYDAKETGRNKVIISKTID